MILTHLSTARPARVRCWPVESQPGARRNAMTPPPLLPNDVRELDEVEEFLAAHGRARS